MDDTQARLNLESDLAKMADEREGRGWRIEPLPLTSVEFFVTMSSRIDREQYTLHFICDGYPDKPPSIRCVNDSTRRADDPRAWPQCEGFRPPPTADLCLGISREGFQTHPEWANDPRYAWSGRGNPIWVALSAIQDRLNDRSKYQGRHSQ